MIDACTKARFNLKRDLCEFDLSSLRPILDAPQHVLKIWLSLSYPSATASLQGWNGSVAPLLVGPSRSTTLGQANFIGRVWMRASS